jgi:hypothetical protein
VPDRVPLGVGDGHAPRGPRAGRGGGGQVAGQPRVDRPGPDIRICRISGVPEPSESAASETSLARHFASVSPSEAICIQ